jgi:ubiquinone biosynthesis protein COQ4
MASAQRIRPREAWHAIRALVANPDDTSQAFRVIGALSGNSGERLLRRFRRSPQGRALLRRKPRLGEVLSDVRRLQALPQGSLGRALGDFFAGEQIDSAGLAAASRDAYGERAPAETSDDLLWLMERLRDQHDLMHVLTGYGRDLRGEAAVLAFTSMQSRNPGVAFIPLYALWRAGVRSELGRLVRQGFRRGRRARWLLDVDWEAELETPLDTLRERLRLGEPPRYEPVRSEGAPPLPQRA